MKHITVLGITLLVLLIVGCSTTSRLEELVPPAEELAITNKHSASVHVSVIGGDMRYTDSNHFETALIQSLVESGVFSSTVNREDTKYKLSVIILKFDRSGMGYEYYITSKWILQNSDDVIVWSDIVGGNGYSSNLGGIARHRAASEGASRATIANGVSELSKLTL